jgi:hypothetical protein
MPLLAPVTTATFPASSRSAQTSAGLALVSDSSTGSPIGSQRMLRRISSGALANSRSIASRPCLKCFQPS